MGEHNPYFDGRTVFSLQVAQLLPGDIVLTRNRLAPGKKGRAQSSVIAAAGALIARKSIDDSAPTKSVG